MSNLGSDTNMFVRSPGNLPQKPIPSAIGPVVLIDDPDLEHVGNFIAMCAGMSYLEAARLPDNVCDTADDLDAFLREHIAKAGLVVVSISKKSADEPGRQALVRYAERVLDHAERCKVPAIVYFESPEVIETVQLDQHVELNTKSTILGFDPKQVDRRIFHSGNVAPMGKLIVAPVLHKKRSAIVALIAAAVRRNPH